VRHSALIWGVLLMVLSACTDGAPTPIARATLASVRSLAPAAGPLTGHTGYVWAVTFSPDGKTLASAGGDNAIILWNVNDPRRPSQLGARLQGHTNWVVSLAFSPDSKTLASGSWDGTVGLWDVTDPAAAEQLGDFLPGQSGSVYTVAFSPTAAVLACGGTDGTIVLWDVTERAAAVVLGSPLSGHKTHVNSLAFSPDGKQLVSGSCAKPENIPDVGYTCDKGELIFWDVSDVRAARRIGKPVQAHTAEVVSLAYHPNGGLLASAGGGAIQLWQAGDKSSLPRPLATLAGKISVQSAAFATTGEILAAGGCGQVGDKGACAAGEALLWSLADPAKPQPVVVLAQGHSDWVTSVAFSPDTGTLATGSWDGTVLLWDLSAE